MNPLQYVIVGVFILLSLFLAFIIGPLAIMSAREAAREWRELFRSKP